MSFKHQVQELLRDSGVTARVSSPSRGWILLDDCVALVQPVRGDYFVELVDPVSGAYEDHGAYNDLRVALSEAVEHLVRYRLIGEHVSADVYRTRAVPEEELDDVELKAKQVHEASSIMQELDRDGQSRVVLSLGRSDIRALRSKLQKLPF